MVGASRAGGERPWRPRGRPRAAAAARAPRCALSRHRREPRACPRGASVRRRRDARQGDGRSRRGGHLGRRLDFQLAYGSPAVFGNAQFLRIADTACELRDNRRGTRRSWPHRRSRSRRSSRPPATARQRATAIGRGPCARGMRSARKAPRTMREAARNRRAHASESRAGRDFAKPRRDACHRADGGDFLSFARVGLPAQHVPRPRIARLHRHRHAVRHRRGPRVPGPVVAVLTGDGSFGFNAMEIDTAVRHGPDPHRRREQRQLADRGPRPGRKPMARWWARGCDTPTMPPWRAPSGMHGERVRARRSVPAALARALANVRRCSTWW